MPVRVRPRAPQQCLPTSADVRFAPFFTLQACAWRPSTCAAVCLNPGASGGTNGGEGAEIGGIGVSTGAALAVTSAGAMPPRHSKSGHEFAHLEDARNCIQAVLAQLRDRHPRGPATTGRQEKKSETRARKNAPRRSVPSDLAGTFDTPPRAPLRRHRNTRENRFRGRAGSSPQRCSGGRQGVRLLEHGLSPRCRCCGPRGSVPAGRGPDAPGCRHPRGHGHRPAGGFVNARRRRRTFCHQQPGRALSRADHVQRARLACALDEQLVRATIGRPRGLSMAAASVGAARVAPCPLSRQVSPKLKGQPPHAKRARA